MLCYADDVAIIFHSKEQLSWIIRNLENWTTQNKMTINKKKSGIMFGRKYVNESERSRNTDAKFNGYPIVEHYKFLGVTIAPNFSVKYHLENIKKKTATFH